MLLPEVIVVGDPLSEAESVPIIVEVVVDTEVDVVDTDVEVVDTDVEVVVREVVLDVVESVVDVDVIDVVVDGLTVSSCAGVYVLSVLESCT